MASLMISGMGGNVTESESSNKQLVIRVADTIDEDLRKPVLDWLRRLITIQQSNASAFAKMREGVAVTLRAKVLWPTVKGLAVHLKTVGWTNQSPKVKWAIAGATISLVAFPGAGAGIAALGTAIGLPLWVVCGAGAAFAQGLYNELGYRIARSAREKSDGQ
jgi:hypothetical protein